MNNSTVTTSCTKHFIDCKRRSMFWCGQVMAGISSYPTMSVSPSSIEMQLPSEPRIQTVSSSHSFQWLFFHATNFWWVGCDWKRNVQTPGSFFKGRSHLLLLSFLQCSVWHAMAGDPVLCTVNLSNASAARLEKQGSLCRCWAAYLRTNTFISYVVFYGVFITCTCVQSCSLPGVMWWC